ncbi:putative mismatched base pair and cruciform DNA recognition protein [Aspergillus steynii IBT 23096]|uniref:Putative mismatched base pair and cruciform DNA recognition protein n=1 Tax=Aspergillus steynii IBT 23096 TaxID=1392250 RepID=A0A2I2GKL3_9EURO|nr:putative mismatched base pair and cruciform DNA recognition protein [Aspergillus steynii IBT 23096]PLB53422.1 putative mismatched base pair and cruciform DNA recognition protein [Aspergillus steynii IBT 23096]
MSSENSSENPSTLKSYVDSATGLAQRAMGTVTGDSSTKTEGETTQSTASAENTASHETAKLGPVTADPHTGATATDHPQRNTGNWDQTIGSAKESLGNLTGYEGLRREGVEQNSRGKAAEAEGQLRDFGSGLKDRAQGGLGKVAAAAKGDREEEAEWERMHDQGKVQQRGAEVDMQKRA